MEKRYEELDSLRGIASFAVLLGHFMLIIPANSITQFIEFGPLRIFVASSEAVTLFFVLSGFVLSLPFYKKDQAMPYFPFLYKRFIRIYLPYYISLAIVIVSSVFFYNGEITRLSSWFNMVWANGLNIKLILDHLLLIFSFPNVQFNPVLWSLVHEMRISIIFPILMFLIIRLKWKNSIVLAIAFSALAFTFYLVFSKPEHDYFHTLHYVSIFILGALLAKHRFHLIEKVTTLSSAKKLLFLLVGLFLYLYAKPAFALNLLLGGRDDFLATILDTWVVSFGAGIIIIISLSSKKFSKVLLMRPVHFLGKISYSLYLYHCIVLFSLTHLLYDLVPIVGIWIISLILSLGISTLSYQYVELPSIKFGRKFKSAKNTNSKNNIEASA